MAATKLESQELYALPYIPSSPLEIPHLDTHLTSEQFSNVKNSMFLISTFCTGTFLHAK